MKKKFKQWWSSIPLISTKRTITSRHVYDFQMSCWWCNINKSNFIWKWMKKKIILINCKIWLDIYYTWNQRRPLACLKIVCSIKWFVIMPRNQCYSVPMVWSNHAWDKTKQLSGKDLTLTLLGWMFRLLYICMQNI